MAHFLTQQRWVADDQIVLSFALLVAYGVPKGLTEAALPPVL